jgi:hypothetical protein
MGIDRRGETVSGHRHEGAAARSDRTNPGQKDNRAVVTAANIMYVVGQYPRFFRERVEVFEFRHQQAILNSCGRSTQTCKTWRVTLLEIARQCKRSLESIAKQ